MLVLMLTVKRKFILASKHIDTSLFIIVTTDFYFKKLLGFSLSQLFY